MGGTLLFDLNEAQLAAVTKRAATLLVTAGPGSGKTRVLVSRALWYLSEGLPFGDILLTTFTRKAAQTIKERLVAGNPGTGGVRVSTIHALAHRALLEEGNVGLRLAPEDFLTELAKRLVKGQGIGPNRFLQLVSRSKNLMRPLGHRIPDLALAMEAYQESLKSAGFLDFDDLVLHAVPIAEGTASRYRAVLADEGQDLSPLEYRFLSALAKDGELTLIGDPAQRIYGFKGALPSFEEAVNHDRAPVATVRLNINYRATRLLTLASESFREPRDGETREAASRDGGKKVVRAALASPTAEAYYVVQRIKAHMGTMFLGGAGGDQRSQMEGLSLGDIAIIYRMRIQGEEILKTLVEEGLPCQISGEDEVTAQDGLDLRADKISLLTMHAAKGLEFRLVFVTGLEEGIVPIGPWYEGEGGDGLEERLAEERRLFYVAVTRAREQLYLTRARRRRLFGRFLSGEPSPFWGLVPEEFLMDVRAERQTRVRNNTLL
jgi:DNA helicase-2/ATP-dependent DNA helicase PcrA